MEEKKTTGVVAALKKMPSAFAILAILILVMSALTWVVPSGKYEMSADDTPEAGTYQSAEKLVNTAQKGLDNVMEYNYIDDLESDDAKENEEVQAAVADLEEAEAINNKQGLWDAIKAPIEGFKDAIEIIVFVIIIGGFLAIEAKIGALQTAFTRVIVRLRGKEQWIIPILMLMFALGGTTYGMQEETVAFYPLIVPLMLAAGYNAMTAVMIIVGGSTIGLIGGTINPFATGIASGFAGVSVGDGLFSRLAILAVSYLVGVFFVMMYAKKVKQGKFAEDSVNDHKIKFNKLEIDADVKMTGKQKATLAVFVFTFLIMIISLIPWDWKFGITFFTDITESILAVPVLGTIIGHIVPFGDWYFMEISTLFLISAIIIAAINKINNNDFVDTFIGGMKDLLAVAAIIGVARGIYIIMAASNIDSTIIHAGEMALSNASGGFLAIASYLFYLPMSILIPSTSGLATVTMPIIAPLANFVGLGRDVIVTAYTAASGVIQMLAPTVGSLMGGLVICGVSYPNYLKRIWKLALALMVISMVILTIVTYLPIN